MEKDTIILNDAKNDQKYYAVCCKCGHAGHNCYVEITFAVKAKNGKEASRIARGFARVKHHSKTAIKSCVEITHDEYLELLKKNSEDPYLKCSNIQEQRQIEGFESRIIKEPENIGYKRNKSERRSYIKYKLKKQKQAMEQLCMFMKGKGNQYENSY